MSSRFFGYASVVRVTHELGGSVAATKAGADQKRMLLSASARVARRKRGGGSRSTKMRATKHPSRPRTGPAAACARVVSRGPQLAGAEAQASRLTMLVAAI